MSHLDEGQLTALLDHELTAAERSAAEAHLMACEECRRLFQEVKAFATEADGLVTAIQVPPRRVPVAESPPRSAQGRFHRHTAWRPRWRTLAWAATVILAVGLGWIASDLRMTRGRTMLDEGSLDSAPGRVAQEVEPPGLDQLAAPRTQAEDKLAVKDNRATKRADERAAARPSPSPPAAPAPQAGVAADAAAPARPANAELAVGKAVPPAAEPVAPTLRAFETVATGAVARKRAGGFREVGMAEAVRALSGSIRLVDGLQPQRVLMGPGDLVQGADAALELVRVVYQDPPGREMWLDQQRPPEADGFAPLQGFRPAMLVGDTIATRGPAGATSIHWIDEHGFRLALTGFLAADSLRAMIPRVH
jgi:hypothetical protein